MAAAGLLCLGLLLGLAVPAWSLSRAERSSTRPVEGRDMDAIRSYTDRLGKDFLKENLGLDLDALAVQLDPRNFDISLPGASSPPSQGAGPGGAPGKPSPLSSKWDLRLEQTDDLMRLQRDARDIPFGLSINGQIPFLASLNLIETSLWLPFSWKDEIRAEAKMPFLVGLSGHRFTLRSDYRNLLGLNRLEAGLGTDFNTDDFGRWDVDYDFQQRFGQGANEEIHWLRFHRSF